MTELTGVKAVSFDVDGTLWDFETVMRRALAEVLKELGKHDPDAARMLDVERMIETRERVHNELRYKITDLNEIRRRSIAQALSEVGRADYELADRLFEVYIEHRDSGRALFDDVLPALAELEGRYTLGLLSNGNSYADRLGIDGLVSFQVFSQDHGGVEKPDPRLFRIAIEQAGCQPDELVHVGDSLDYDVAGATAAGVRGVWLNRNGGDPAVTPDRVPQITSLHELTEIL